MKKFTEQLEEQKFLEKYQDFLEFCCERLELEDLPVIELINDKKMAMENKSFGGYHPGTQEIKINIAERHLADVFRTLAHELTHYKQHIDNRLDENSGETGSDIENEANAMAGILMREYARATEGNIFEEVVMENYSGRPSWKGAQAIANKQLQQRAGDAYDVYVPHPTVAGTTSMLKSHNTLGAAKDTVRDYLRVHPDHQARTAIFSSRGKHVLDTKTNKWANLKEGSGLHGAGPGCHSTDDRDTEGLAADGAAAKKVAIRQHHKTLMKLPRKELEARYKQVHRISDTNGVPKERLATACVRAHWGNDAVDKAFDLKEESEGILVESRFTGRLGASRYTKQLDHLGDALEQRYNTGGAKAVREHLDGLDKKKYGRHLHALNVFNMGKYGEVHPVTKIIRKYL